MWLTPPFMKSQMTFFAFGGKCGRPVGGAHAVLAKPSRWSMAPSASPVKPMPMSARKVRRERAECCGSNGVLMRRGGLTERDEVVVIE